MDHIKAVAFDLYGTLFDVHSVAARCDELFPGHGQDISAMWRQKQLEYTFLRSLMNRYIPFEQVTEEALRFTLRQLGLDLDERSRHALSDTYLRLQAYPEVPGALQRLRERGLKLAVLSNGSQHSIGAVVGNAGLRDSFDELLSVDPVRVFKPHDRVYALAEEAFKLNRREILFVSSNAWDATGARYFGFPVCWVNRGGKVFDEMGQRPDFEVGGVDEVVTVLEERQQH